MGRLMGSRSNIEAARLALFRRRAMNMADMVPPLEWATRDFVIRKSYAWADYFTLGIIPVPDPNERLENDDALGVAAKMIARHYPRKPKDREFVLQELYRCARQNYRQQTKAEGRQATKLLRFKQTY